MHLAKSLGDSCWTWPKTDSKKIAFASSELGILESRVVNMQTNLKTKDEQHGEHSFVVMSFQVERKERTKEAICTS